MKRLLFAVLFLALVSCQKKESAEPTKNVQPDTELNTINAVEEELDSAESELNRALEQL